MQELWICLASSSKRVCMGMRLIHGAFGGSYTKIKHEQCKLSWEPSKLQLWGAKYVFIHPYLGDHWLTYILAIVYWHPQRLSRFDSTYCWLIAWLSWELLAFLTEFYCTEVIHIKSIFSSAREETHSSCTHTFMMAFDVEHLCNITMFYFSTRFML